MNYTAPRIKDLGSVLDLTLVSNKDGLNPDVFSAVVPVIGSLVPPS